MKSVSNWFPAFRHDPEAAASTSHARNRLP